MTYFVSSLVVMLFNKHPTDVVYIIQLYKDLELYSRLCGELRNHCCDCTLGRRIRLLQSKIQPTVAVGSEIYLKEFYLFLNFRLHIHSAYSDPLGWTEQQAFTVHQFNFKDLTDLVKQTPHTKPVTLIIDSLSWILRHVTPPAVCKTLHQLRKGELFIILFAFQHQTLLFVYFNLE